MLNNFKLRIILLKSKYSNILKEQWSIYIMYIYINISIKYIQILFLKHSKSRISTQQVTIIVHNDSL